MSPREALVALADGRRPGDRILGACRMQWAGSEAFGEEAVLELFRAAPVDLVGAVAVITRASAALIGDDTALVADLYDGRISRIWRLGPGQAPAREPFVAVAFDTDLSQERAGVFFRAEDHPELSRASAGAVAAAGRSLIDVPDAHRARAFAIRAFDDGDVAAALFTTHQLSGGQVRQAGESHAVALIGPDGMRLLRDQLRPREWTTRL